MKKLQKFPPNYDPNNILSLESKNIILNSLDICFINKPSPYISIFDGKAMRQNSHAAVELN